MAEAEHLGYPRSLAPHIDSLPVSAISFDLSTHSGQADAAKRLDAGEVVALPTDTVSGLAVRADLADAGALLAKVKGSPTDRPFTLHLANLAAVQNLVPVLPPALPAWLEEYLPQGITVLLPKDWVELPANLDWPWELVGLRLPTNPQYRDLTDILGFPLLMTSINSSGESPLEGPALIQWLEERQISYANGLDLVKDATPSDILAFDRLPRVIRRGAKAAPPMPGKRVLILCSGNICRSPVAEAILREMLAQAWQVQAEELESLGWVIASAGTFAMTGGAISEHSYAVGQEMGFDLSSHRSQHLDDAMHQSWDLVLGMGPNHLGAMPEGVTEDLFDPTGLPVPDPFGGELQHYQNMRDHLIEAARHRVALWAHWPQDQS